MAAAVRKAAGLRMDNIRFAHGCSDAMADLPKIGVRKPAAMR
jgi:hypothetical protein